MYMGLYVLCQTTTNLLFSSQQYELFVEIKKGAATTSKMEAWLNEGVDINYIYHNGESLLQAAG